MRVLIVEPLNEPYVRDIDNSLSKMQEIVGGYIEAAGFFDDVILVCNVEGKLDGSLPNRIIWDKDGEIADIIHGTFFLCEYGEEDFKSISAENIEKYGRMFSFNLQRDNLSRQAEYER